VARPQQQIRFCKSADGTRLAYASCGEGPALVWVGHFARHLELDWENPIWRAWLTFLSRRHTLIRYDLRGCGLSDRNVAEISLDRLAEDFEAVIGAANLDKFIFFGTAGNVAPGIHHAVQHPDRVAQLILYGCHTRGPLVRPRTPEEGMEAETRLKAIEFGWANRNVAFGDFFTTLHAPAVSSVETRALSDLLRTTTSAANAVRLIKSYWHLDLRNVLQQVRCPSLIMHAREDPIVPFEEGRLAASLVPDARFLPLDSRNHILQENEPAWQQLTEGIEEFLPAPCGSAALDLTPREREVLESLAQGHSNKTIALQLRISEKTVRNHLSHIFDKLGVKNRAQGAVLAREQGFGRKGFRRG
jgi:pimeloyl-ACP methyl ester carboxylesterase/DNA-binding CsgD family transcriptional regulator